MTDIPATHVCKKCGEEKPYTAEYFYVDRIKKYGLGYTCKPCHNKFPRNRQKAFERNRQWREQNPERRKQQDRLYRERHKETIAARGRLYRLSNPEKRAEEGRLYRERKRALLKQWTSQHELVCLIYWHQRCAVCDAALGGLLDNKNRHIDHWHPLNQPGCPGTIVENMIPLCPSCNTSKHDKLPADWLILHYKPAQVKAILKRVADYFEWVKRQDDEQSA